MPPELMVELVEEILLRLPPDDPASLVHAALVCKLWCRLVTGTAFHRRFREFHSNTPPLLGLVYTGDCKLIIHNNDTPGDTDHNPTVKPVRSIPVSTAYFISMTSFRPAHAADGWRAIDARHGRVLLYRTYSWRTPIFSVWDPVTDEQQELPELPFDMRHRYFAAVACAAAANGNCNHLDCHQGPFLVVVMVIKPCVMLVSVYSSESGTWRQVADFENSTPNFIAPFARAPSILVGSAFYFLLHINSVIVKYDLATWEVSKIHLPSKFHQLLGQQGIVLMIDDDAGLGFVASTEYQLELWSMVTGEDAGFVLKRVIDLVRLLPCAALIKNSPQVSGFVDVGANRFLFMRTCNNGLYSIETNSSQVKKVANCCDNDKVVLPYAALQPPRVQPS